MNTPTDERGTGRRYLLIEDDPSHAELIRMSLSMCDSHWDMDHVDDGEKGLAFVRREGEYADVPRPDVVLLDLKLPRLNGHQVLEALKSDPETSSIPVIMLTTSADDRDRQRAIESHANSYVVKPVAGGELHQMVKDMDDYWSRWHTFEPED